MNTGAGNDSIVFNENISAVTVAIDLGDGNNQLILAASKALSTSSFNLTSGSDNDTLIFAGALNSTGTLDIVTGAGVDQLDFQDDVNGTAVTIDLGDGDNQFDLAASKTLTASSFDLTTGSGNDTLIVCRSTQ